MPTFVLSPTDAHPPEPDSCPQQPTSSALDGDKGPEGSSGPPRSKNNEESSEYMSAALLSRTVLSRLRSPGGGGELRSPLGSAYVGEVNIRKCSPRGNSSPLPMRGGMLKEFVWYEIESREGPRLLDRSPHSSSSLSSPSASSAPPVDSSHQACVADDETG